MTEKKVVIRVNYSPGKRAKTKPEPEMVTEWHVGRIIVAMLLVALIMGTGFWALRESAGPVAPPEVVAGSEIEKERMRPLMNTSDSVSSVGEPASSGGSVGGTSSPTVQAETEEVPLAGDSGHSLQNEPESEVILPKDTRVVQAVLSRALYERRPVDIIDGKVYAQPDRAIGIFYFTELKSMKGQRVIHEWWHEGKLIFSKVVRVHRDRASFYTSKLVNTRMLGVWDVYLKGNRGHVLDHRQFELLAPSHP